jgi:2,4-dienoyl-CoA reductase (NADPH2)
MKIFEPFKIGNMEIKNRIVMAPMTVDYANPDETPSDRHLAYYSERAKGGVGLITLEVVTVDGDHRYQQNSLGLYNDSLIAPHKKLVDAIHAHGAKVVPQISHTGPESLGGFFKQIQPVGPSVVRTATTLQVCRELKIDEISRYVEMYGDAAIRAREAGYDGIELHAAHSYMLLGSFLSPLRNHRSDEYRGNKPEGRMKLLLEVLANIRKKVGNDFPITLRLSGYERESGSREINDTVRMAPLLVKAGVNAFHVSGGVGDLNITQIIPAADYPVGYNVAMAAAIKQVVDVPVMAVGRIMTIDDAEKVLQSKQADAVVMGRAFFADPHLINKAKAGKVETIRPCIVCQDCVDTIMPGGGSACAVNVNSGREWQLPMKELAAKSKYVVVIGGGMGGMEAARVAAERGHKVTLIEKQKQLGGNFILAAQLLNDLQPFLDWMLREMKRLTIEIKLGTEANEQSIAALKPDAIIVAIGGNNTVPYFAGAEHAVSGSELYKLVHEDFKGMSGDIVVLGGGVIAVEIADAIAKTSALQKISSVTMLNWDNRVADGAGRKRRGDLSRRLDKSGVRVLAGMPIVGASRNSVTFRNVDGSERTIKAGHILFAADPQPNGDLAERLKAITPEVKVVGDCAGFGLVKKAIKDATLAVYAI